MNPALATLTDCGLPGVKAIPYGVHMCTFYDGARELAGALVPYFVAGLRNNERCIWIAAAPLPAVDALAALRACGLVDVDAALERGALVVRDYSEWYARSGSLKGNAVLGLWLAEEARALEEGYAGLRITGNVTFLREQDWPLFMEYEALIDETFRGRRIVTLCTYGQHACGAAEIHDVATRHSCTLDRPDEGWQLLTRPGA